jgi:hypothetical protein
VGDLLIIHTMVLTSARARTVIKSKEDGSLTLPDPYLPFEAMQLPQQRSRPLKKFLSAMVAMCRCHPNRPGSRKACDRDSPQG